MTFRQKVIVDFELIIYYFNQLKINKLSYLF
jgi:hypothetical protein